MTEISKMFENAGIKPLCQIPDEYCGLKNVYEDFTAEKQLSLIKCLFKISDTENINIECEDKFCIHNVLGQSDDCDTLEDALASYINDIWQSLTDQEKKEIRNILNA